MNTESLQTLDPGELREKVMDHEEEIRRLAKELGLNGQFTARCNLRDAADLLLSAGRSLAAEMPDRPELPTRPSTQAVMRPAT